jgi:crotonobetainyl-CoA:carnitine CoA-transferase CaiB-like acyl-CoA transferase
MQEASAWATQTEWNVTERGEEPSVVPVLDGFVVAIGNSKEFAAYIEARGIDLARLTRAEVTRLLSDKLMVGSVNTVGEAISHPQTEARALFYTCPSADGDSWQIFSLPFKLMSTPSQVRAVISRLGFDNKNVLAELKRMEMSDSRDPFDLY